MADDLWTAVDNYVVEALALEDGTLARVERRSRDAGLPAIQVSAAQGKLLEIITRMTGARKILELGTLGGYSTIWLARGMTAGGTIVTIEIDGRHADVARENFADAGFAGLIDLRVGRALDEVPRLHSGNAGPFDLAFIDADKPNIPAYFDWTLRMSRSGSVIIVDNVVREGAVADAASTDDAVLGVRRLNDLLRADPRLDSTVIQTVGTKGYDGFAIARVR